MVFLWLATISKNLVELHKGKLWFKSSIDKEDHGTTFYFSLPVYKEKPHDEHEDEGALFATKQSQQQTTKVSSSDEDTGDKLDKEKVPSIILESTKTKSRTKPEDSTQTETNDVSKDKNEALIKK